MKDSGKLQNQVRSINQLLSVIVGQKFARETDELKTFPSKRVRRCLELTLVEHKQASDSLDHDAAAASRALSQVHRKLDSLHSLSVLADCVEENLWDLNE